MYQEDSKVSPLMFLYWQLSASFFSFFNRVNNMPDSNTGGPGGWQRVLGGGLTGNFRCRTVSDNCCHLGEVRPSFAVRHVRSLWSGFLHWQGVQGQSADRGQSGVDQPQTRNLQGLIASYATEHLSLAFPLPSSELCLVYSESWYFASFLQKAFLCPTTQQVRSDLLVPPTRSWGNDIRWFWSPLTFLNLQLFHLLESPPRLPPLSPHLLRDPRCSLGRSN